MKRGMWVAALVVLATAGGLRGQICLHGISGPIAAFGTNGNGLAVSSLAHPGDTIALQISANYLDQCGSPPNNQGDRSVVTNMTISVCAAGLTFTTTNLLTTNAIIPLPPGNILSGRWPILDPGYPSYTPLLVTSGPFAGASLLLTIPTNCSGKLAFTGNVEVFDTNNVNGQSIGGHFGAQWSTDLQLVNPALCIGATCSLSDVGGPPMVNWISAVTNCGVAESAPGNNTLSGVVVRNHFNVVPAGHAQDEIVLGPITLTNGQSRIFSGSYAANCVTTSATLTVSGTDILLCPVVASTSVTCIACPESLLPKLSLAQANGEVVITWPTSAIAFRLVSATNLDDPAWSPVTSSVVVTNGQNRVKEMMILGRKFFRLQTM